jgi:site-specific DNA recombinase
MRNFAAYIRVSTVRQGERGVSLVEQRSIIEAYAAREQLAITKWFEERETAAHVGRTHFRNMLRDLKRGKYRGLILHKIDRGARNLSDWAALSELADGGIDVRIAGDTLDLASRGGRLSADIQAVVAADYIRNLREEVKKGQRGRLKQGLYPWAAPIGYLDTGGGKAKAIDPVRGPLVRRAFELYATGNYSIRTLRAVVTEWGLRTPGGKPMSRNAVNAMLRRPFYYGLIEVGTDSYAGVHPPLISKELFDKVGAVLDGRISVRSYEKHVYALRRMVECTVCTRHLYAETQKGHAYYRCHTDGCQGTCYRETALVRRVLDDLDTFPITDAVIAKFQELAATKREELVGRSGSSEALARLQLGRIEERLSRLTDAYLDGAVDREALDARKKTLEVERLEANTVLANPGSDAQQFESESARCLELLKALKTLDETATSTELRDVLKSVVSNCMVNRNDVAITWASPIHVLFAEEPVLVGPHAHDSYRTPDESNGVSGTSDDEAVRRKLVLIIERLRTGANSSEGQVTAD